MTNHENGFGTLGTFLLGVVIGLILLTGWFVYSVGRSTKVVIHNSPTVIGKLTAPVPQPAPTDELHVPTLPDTSTANWQNFQESNGRIGYAYPPDWTFKNSGLIYYGPNEATSDNKQAIQTITSPGVDAKADYAKDYGQLSGAQIIVRVTDDNSSQSAKNATDYCQIQPELLLERIDNAGTPLCLKMGYIPDFYNVGATYCHLLLNASIILGERSSVAEKQYNMQVLIALAKTWNFKNVCTTDPQHVEHLYFGP